MYQSCCIVEGAKKALKDESTISFRQQKYENKIEFEFLTERKFLSSKIYKANNVEEWFNHCVKSGVQDIKMLAPVAVKDRAILGFSNTTQSSIVCYYEKKVTFFAAKWEFDSEHQEWNVLYKEYEWKEAPPKKVCFDNNIDDFKVILLRIQRLAIDIHCDNFAKVFQKAHDILLGTGDFDTIPDASLPELPEENLRLLKAANTADVFGAMGSWNDSPPYSAHEKGLDEEYELLSNELLKQLRLAILYAVNEW